MRTDMKNLSWKDKDFLGYISAVDIFFKFSPSFPWFALDRQNGQ